MIDTTNVPGIATAGLLCSLNISVWEGRKKDKTIEGEVAIAKGARSSKATSVYKTLFVDCPALEAIKSLRGEARQYLNKYSTPWDHNGTVLVPTALFVNTVQAGMAAYEQRFNTLVTILTNVWNTEISKQAFERGSMFNRDEYPTADEVREKFSFSFTPRPVPLSGDFRVDIGNEALKQVQEMFEAENARCVERAVAGTWERVKAQVEWVQERMAAVLDYDPDATETDEDGKVTKKRRPKLYDSMVETGVGLCGMLRDLNITNDPKLEEARQMLESALVRVDTDSLKESPELQSSLKKAMDDIADKFDF